MSAALKRRFNFETVFPIADFDTELALVETRGGTACCSAPACPCRRDDDVLEVLVTTFRELRAGETERRRAAWSGCRTVMSTAEAVSVAHAVGVRGWFLRGEAGTPADIVECLAGTAAKDNAEDLARLRRYLEQQASKRSGAHGRPSTAARQPFSA